jgi:murein DD-endopeptidase MepM/ murein hydrolase activator NlpD
MSRLRYTYNPETCRYEPIVISPRAAGKNILGFLAVTFLMGLSGVIYFNVKFPPLDETFQAEVNQRLQSEWQVIYKQLDHTSRQLKMIEQNDDHNYRVILDLDPLDETQREAGVGGREKVSALIPYPLIRTAYEKVEKIQNRLDIEAQSMEELKRELERKEKMWASRPAIQPVSNKHLTHLHTLFGLRLHPLLGYVRPHNGLDFSAPKGSPVYATGDGKVVYSQYSKSYGNVIFINHGFNFETRYAHLSEYIVQPGQTVKRGQVIGYVGNTGLSVADHLHYEVLYKGQFINPINFFQRDLNNREYEKLIEIGSRYAHSLD